MRVVAFLLFLRLCRSQKRNLRFRTRPTDASGGSSNDPFQEHMRLRRQRLIDGRDVQTDLRTEALMPPIKSPWSKDVQSNNGPRFKNIGQWIAPQLAAAVASSAPLGTSIDHDIIALQNSVSEVLEEQRRITLMAEGLGIPLAEGLPETRRQIVESSSNPMSSFYFPHIDPAIFEANHQVHLLRDDAAEEILAGIRYGAKPVPRDKLTVKPGLMRPVQVLASVPEILKYPAPSVPMDKIMPISSNKQILPKFRSGADRFVQDWSTDIVKDDWWGGVTRKAGQRFTSATVANKNGVVSTGIGLRDGVTDVGAGWKDFIFYEYTNRAAEEVAVGVAKGKYGVFIDRSNLHRATAAQVIARNVATSTLIDMEDRDYGQRIRVRGIDISFRHDFDEYLTKDPDEFATELTLGIRRVGLALSTDIADAVYAVTVGVRGRQVSFLHDFDDRKTEALVLMGRGWKGEAAFDFIDPFSDALYGRLAFGKAGLATIGVGAGIADDGIPQADVSFELPNTAAFIRVLDTGGRKSLDVAITVGKFTYAWRSAIAPHNLRLPKPFGFEPTDVMHFLSGKTPVVTGPKLH